MVGGWIDGQIYHRWMDRWISDSGVMDGRVGG